jgi:uncharacterized membrane protein (UPF0182 family)
MTQATVDGPAVTRTPELTPVPTRSQAPSKPTLSTPAGFTQLAAGGALLRRAAGGTIRRRSGALRRWSLRLLIVAVVLVLLWKLFTVVVGLVTNDMWFNSVYAGSVYTTMLGAEILLFCVFGILAAIIGGLTLFAIQRIHPLLPLSSDNDTFRWTFRKYESRVRRLLVVVAALVPGILVGRQAAARWQTYLLWEHAQSFHATDPVFHKDVSFYVEVYPFHQLVATLLLQAVTYGLWICVVGGYWYGAWRLRRGSKKVTGGFTRIGSVLVAAYLVVRAYNYWLSRYALTTSNRGPVTGASYTDRTAALPGAYVLMAVALIAAVLLLLNAFRLGRVRVLAATLVATVVLVELIGSAWPGLLYHYREAPSASSVDLGEIADNQVATRKAFGLDGHITTVGYHPAKTTSSAALVKLADKSAQISLIDPNQLSPTFNVQQQVQAYYGFKGTLDTSHYDIDGHQQDVALAVRELQTGGIPQQSWINTHLVYTHGYGVVAAPTTKVDPNTESPDYLDGGMPPGEQIPISRPQVYYGQSFPSSSYAIVGQPSGSSRNLEFDHPAGKGSTTPAHSTYTGAGGIPMGSALRRLLFAVQLHSPNVFFSSETNSASRLLMVRNPRARVAKVAPWLTLDGDVYPAVVDGQIKWIVDGYTTSSNYPESQLVNLNAATTTTLTAHGASVQQPNRRVNYMQNSVKAVVDAYTGSVTLYEWNQQAHPDPLLKAWESAFPGLVKPQSSITPALMSQLRYPTDLFNVQRTLLAKYRVAQPADFYSGNDFWTVPSDPTYGRTTSGPSMPSRYMSMSADGYGDQHYSLSSPMVNLSGQELQGFIYVDSEPGPGYGHFTLLNLAPQPAGESPAQVQNDIESDTRITETLTLQRSGHSKVVLGDLEAVPVGGRLLYVEPVYTKATGGGASFPVLRHVIALYGDGKPSFADKLQTAIKDAIVSAVGKDGNTQPR